MKNLLIFDLDGVITSEETYWDCAGLTLHELLYSPRYWHISNSSEPYRPAASARESRTTGRATLPAWLILSFKSRALNSNWDTCYAGVCLHLLDLLGRLPDRSALLPLAPTDAHWLARLRAQVARTNLASSWQPEHLHTTWQTHHPFDQPIFAGAVGLDLFARLDIYATHLLGISVEGVFARNQPFWRFCQDIFQEWLLGETLYPQTYGHMPTQPDKPGCIFFEEPLLPVEQIRVTLETLRARGYTLGIATGRVWQEAAYPLKKYNLLAYFDEQHMGTYDKVTHAEQELRARGDATLLGKPHPFQFQAAVDGEAALHNALKGSTEPLPTPFIAVGDSTSDILGGRAAGGLTVAVLTGSPSPEARARFLQSQPDFVIENMTDLPALLDEIENLATIQKLQFERRPVAEKLLRLWFVKQMDLVTEHVHLTPKAVSLNSFNGFYTNSEQEYFFKTHVEEHGVLNEYYHADLLDQAGYNIVRPLRLLQEKNRQIVIYPVIKSPVVFDLMRALETGGEMPPGVTARTLLEAERVECHHLLEIYANTFQPAQDTSNAPIDQLFWHRLVKRFEEFYAGKTFPVPTSEQTENISFTQLMRARWIINGVVQEKTLGELVELGRRVLDPARSAATVVGHGDAHFGNVFLEGTDTGQRYLYFDPAFAGRHSPLLDIIKPLFHNVFATWMYFPAEIAPGLHLSVRVENDCLIVQHDYRPTPIRQALLQIKQEHLLRPLLAWLREQGALPDDWPARVKLALMCCPLLTVDLFDETKRPPALGWLGLAQAVMLGNGNLFQYWKEEKQ